MVYVNSPEEYIKNQKSSFEKKAAIANYKKHGASIAITTGGLKCDLNELLAFLNQTLEVYKHDEKRSNFFSTVKTDFKS